MTAAVVEDRWLSLAEASARTGYSREFLRRLFADGVIAASKPGGAWRVHCGALDEWMAGPTPPLAT